MAVSAKHDEFNHWWATEGDWVEEPNYRRNGMSGVQCVERNGKKAICKAHDASSVSFRTLSFRPTNDCP